MNLGVEIWVPGVYDPASPYGHAIAMLHTVGQRNQALFHFHAERIHNHQTELVLCSEDRFGILGVSLGWRGRWRGEILIRGIRGDVELPIHSERVRKRYVSAR